MLRSRHRWHRAKLGSSTSRPNGKPAPASAENPTASSAARTGFDWSDASSVFAKLEEEIIEIRAELDRNMDPDALEDEMGDILFTAANLARKLDVDPEAALRRATAKFERRFRRVEALAAARTTGTGTGLEALDALWQEVKRDE